MIGLKQSSLAFKSAIVYIIITILNISVFVAMVFENQQDLISENAVLNSEMKGINLKFRVDNILQGENAVTPDIIAGILKEAKFLGIKEISMFGENGSILKEVEHGKFTQRTMATPAEIQWINKAITKNNFEDKIFTHRIKKADQLIELYVPVTYGLDKILLLRPVLAMEDINRQMTFLFRQCIIIGLLLIVIHFGMGIFFMRMIIIPLKNLMNATDLISKGDLQARVEIIRNDEIGRLAISFNEMTVALARMQDEAKGANPLSGLPGNISIVNDIEKRLKAGEKFAVLYCDLDNFKAYNDKYGFSKGDHVILFTRDCLLDAAKKKGKGVAFVGHEGGDDFVIVTSLDTWEDIAKNFIASLDYGISKYYNETDAKNRYILSVNRQGVPMRFPLISVSVAVVSNERRVFSNHVEVVSVAAEMKKFVKSKEGSCYAIDRRTDNLPRTGTPPQGAAGAAPAQQTAASAAAGTAPAKPAAPAAPKQPPGPPAGQAPAPSA